MLLAQTSRHFEKVLVTRFHAAIKKEWYPGLSFSSLPTYGTLVYLLIRAMLRKIILIPVYRKPTQFLNLFAFAGFRSMSTKAELCIQSPTTLVDEKLDIRVKGLSPNQNVTLQAKIVDESNKTFVSHAFYQSNEAGEVLVSSQPSTGGSYTGIEPMGLLWSVQGVAGLKKGASITKKDIMKPLRYTLGVFDDHVDPNQSSDEEMKRADRQPLVSSTIKRLYCKPGVQRVVVRDGRLRGVLFIPPGEGPFPGTTAFVYVLS